MHRFGWLLIGFGALLLLAKGGLFLLPPLLLFLFLSAGRGLAHGMHPYGGPPAWRGHARHGRHGHRHHGCRPHQGPADAEPREAQAEAPQPYTGETTRL